MELIILLLIAYLIGSIPSALWVGKLFYKTDIREHGSGNLGGTNTFRVLGKTAGLTVTILDILKGTVAALLPLLPIFDSVTRPSAYSRNSCGCRTYVSRLRSFQRWQSCCDIRRCVACL